MARLTVKCDFQKWGHMWKSHQSLFITLREKEGDLTQFYGKNPYTNRQFENQWTTQKRHQKLRLHNEFGPT